MTTATLDFSLPNVDGGTISLGDYPDAKGYAVVFSCNHCPYAVAYEERLKAFAAKYTPMGYPLIVISVNDPVKYPQDSYENMQVRAAQKGFNFPYLYDASQNIAHAYGAERTPHVFLLNADRKVVYRGAFDDNYENPAAVSERYLENAIADLEAGRPVAQPQTNAIGCSIKWK